MFWGADTHQVRAHGGSCRAATERLGDLQVTLQFAVASVEWGGPDADSFRRHVTDVLAPQWERARAELESMSQDLVEHAEHQDAASEPSGERSAEGDREGTGRGAGVWAGAEAGAGIGAGAGAGEDGERRGPRDGDPRRGRRPHDPVDQDPGDPQFGTGGPDPYPGGLGPGRAGTAVPVPDPPSWTPPDEGSGEYDVRDPGFSDYANYELAEAIAAGGDVTGKGPAADNMRHFLGNSGEDKPIDVDDMLDEAPGFAADVDSTRQQLGAQAIERAQGSGATGPVTFPVNTDWEGYYVSSSESEKYYYATAGMQYNVNGTVTAYPPSEPGGEWRYEMSAEVNTRDRYNWDTGKSTSVGPISVDDEQMQDLHESGLAQEYNIVGESSQQTTTGP